MPQASLEVGIIVERRRLTGPWSDHAWMPVAALPGVPQTEPWTLLEEGDGMARFYAGAGTLELYSSETGHYRDNLVSGRPSLWVVLRPGLAEPGVELLSVLADPYEAEGLTEPGTDIVEPVPMPAEIEALIAEFVERHHVERSFFKRRRDAADPEALARRGRRGAPGEEE